MSEIKYKSIPLENAVGMMLGHDLTQIVPGEFKGPAFKKGHIIKEEDVSQLLDMGKKNIYVLDTRDGYVHENEAAQRMARAASGNGIKHTEPSEGRINFISTGSGLLKINKEALLEINSVEDVTFATIHGNQIVEEGTAMAGTRIIPLATFEKNIAEVERICKEYYPAIDVKHTTLFRFSFSTEFNIFHIPSTFTETISLEKSNFFFLNDFDSSNPAP